ncbi:MAG: 16S rRNA (guanine966-N2)-methyltransferase [Gammaproteobacteria bacterium]
MPENVELRPTPSRVRETLFNWLSPVIDGANCLDLFAGSGALGFEALSRGAARVTMVEQNRNSVNMLVQQSREFQTAGLNIVCDDAMNYLDASVEKFDIVFLDPPFSKNLLQNTCETLLNKGHLGSKALVYLESDGDIAITSAYTISKQGKAGKVHYMLLESSLGRETKEC